MPKPKLPDAIRRDIRLVLRINSKEARVLSMAAQKRGLDIAKFVRIAIANEIKNTGKSVLPKDFPDVV